MVFTEVRSMYSDFDLINYIKQLEQSTDIRSCESVPVPDIEENQNYIFISYSHKDYKAVYADLAVMYQAGVRFWYDRGLSAGKDWDVEVKSRIEDPKCCGVIFFLSESLFLSKSANLEIDYVCGSDGISRKNYFCVNLTQMQPKGILRSIMSIDDEAFEQSGLDMERIRILSGAFRDNQTYLYHSDAEHKVKLLEQITAQFDVIEKREKKQGVLLTENGEEILITPEPFLIGRERGKCHYIVNDGSVSRMHASISVNGGETFLMDHGAACGTFLNGTRLNQLVAVPIHHGDTLIFGRVSMTYHEK